MNKKIYLKEITAHFCVEDDSQVLSTPTFKTIHNIEAQTRFGFIIRLQRTRQVFVFVFKYFVLNFRWENNCLLRSYSTLLYDRYTLYARYFRRKEVKLGDNRDLKKKIFVKKISWENQ